MFLQVVAHHGGLVIARAAGDDEDTDLAFLPQPQGEVELRRIPYDIETTQRKIIAAGLPAELAERLALGK